MYSKKKRILSSLLLVVLLLVSTTYVSANSTKDDEMYSEENYVSEYTTAGIIDVLSPNISELSATYKESEISVVGTSEEENTEEFLTDVDDVTMYTNCGVNFRMVPDIDNEYNIISVLPANTEVTVLAQVTGKDWYQVQYDDNIGYIALELLSDEPVNIEAQTYNTTWTGATLNSYSGTVQGPSGKETYYNLNMSNIVRMMHNRGYNYEYWVRSDGVKMLGNYVMVAADLNIRPRGSLVETSLGTGIVCDTGTFIYSNHYQLDIATTW